MLNKQLLIGNLGNDPQVHNFENGGKVATFSVATKEVFYNKEKKKVQQTDWHSVKCFKKLAERVETYLKKGAKVYIEGRSITEEWEDKQGVKRYSNVVIADQVLFLDSKKD